MFRRETIVKGLIAGLIAGVIMDGTEQGAHYLFRRPAIPSVQWASIIATQKPTENTSQFLMAQLSHLVFTSLLGGVFAAFVSPWEGKRLILKGWLWAMAAGCISQLLLRVFRVPILSKPGWRVRLEHFVMLSLYGLVLGEITRQKKFLVWW